tara:strand:- start:150 stop:689 length:540 start_codon:yes stop_codon:yes gene_type:complete
LLAIILFYVFYYEANDDKVQLNKNLVDKERLTEEKSSNYFENVEYKGIDANGNRYLLKSDTATFDEESPELINMIGMNATFYFKDGKILRVSGKTGRYNNKTNDMEFRENVKIDQAANKISADNLDYFNSKKFINIYGNVKGKSLDGNFTADILKLDIENQAVDFSMKDNEQVKININK